MSATHGKDAALTYDGENITEYVNQAGLSQEGENGETTTFGKDSKTYIPGLKDGTLSLEGPFDPAVHAILAPLFNTENELVFFPAGNGSGQPKATVQAILSSYEVSTEVGDVASISGELQFTGDVVWGTV